MAIDHPLSVAALASLKEDIEYLLANPQGYSNSTKTRLQKAGFVTLTEVLQAAGAEAVRGRNSNRITELLLKRGWLCIKQLGTNQKLWADPDNTAAQRLTNELMMAQKVVVITGITIEEDGTATEEHTGPNGYLRYSNSTDRDTAASLLK